MSVVETAKTPIGESSASFKHAFKIDNKVQVEKRIRYNFWTALSDIGGFHDGIRLLMNIFVAPIAYIAFQNDVMKNFMYS